MNGSAGTSSGGESGLADTECRICGAHVSRGFVRVFGNNRNELYGCLECSTAKELRGGAATDSETLPESMRG